LAWTKDAVRRAGGDNRDGAHRDAAEETPSFWARDRAGARDSALRERRRGRRVVNNSQGGHARQTKENEADDENHVERERANCDLAPKNTLASDREDDNAGGKP
jgi:hypothetical protein